MRVVTISENKAHDVAWRKLRKYHDEQLSVKWLMEMHSLPRAQKENARKQAQQISFSLTQAWEFSQAARQAGATTKALLAYYFLTSLANVEVLWRGDGRSSFDQRPAEFNSHGFALVRDSDLLNFRAEPITRRGNLVGLYGLWRKTASHLPYNGLQTTLYPNGSQEGHYALTGVEPLRDIFHPTTAVSLWECFAHLPGLHMSVSYHGIQSKLARGKVTRAHRFSPEGKFLSTKTDLIIHPCHDDLTNAVLDQFKVPPSIVPQVSFLNPPSGALISWIDEPPYGEGSISLPEAFPWSTKESFFLADGSYANEFGYMYLGLYIAGMITRYHPQTWIKELRTMSHASSLVDEFVDHALQRLPMLTLAAIDNEMMIYA